MTIEEIQYEAQGIMQEWGSNDSAPYVEFVEKLASMKLSEPSLPSNLDEAAEKAALKAYPEKDALNKKATGHYDPNYPRRKAYQQGYEQAEKDLAALALGKLELS